MPTAPAPACLVSTCPERQPCPVHAAQARTLRRSPWDRWYRIARWAHPVAGLRVQTLRRDGYGCVVCRQAGRVEPATDVDHVVPHHGDPTLFWDPANLQSLCRSHHSEKSARGL